MSGLHRTDNNSIDMNVSVRLYDKKLYTRHGVAARLKVDTGIGNVDVDSYFTKQGDTYTLNYSSDAKNKVDLTRCAEDILLIREAHFPATIAKLYDPENIPADLREAHERNDEVLERIYIGRRFRNDTERLEKMFELYTKMTAGTTKKRKAGGKV